MVALKKYARIEASGLWRASADEQRREVIVTLGDATLTVKTLSDQALAHWSIAAIARENPGAIPARYFPEGDPEEQLELAGDEDEMVEAIETLRRAVEKARPKPGRLRWLGLTSSALAVVLGAVFWLPGALMDHALNVVPPVGQREIGARVLTQMIPMAGPPCGTSETHSSLNRLGRSLGVSRLAILRGGLAQPAVLPGGFILLPRALVEDYDGPDVAAGYILAAQQGAAERDPLQDLLEHSGFLATFALLTTGVVPEEATEQYARRVVRMETPTPDTEALLARFEAVGVPSTPYAYARDVSGETVLELIEADPMQISPVRPILSDADWLRLQSICAG